VEKEENENRAIPAGANTTGPCPTGNFVPCACLVRPRRRRRLVRARRTEFRGAGEARPEPDREPHQRAVQNNTNFNYGPLDGTQNILNIQPVIPVTLDKDWNLITRTILPLISQPPLVQGENAIFGLGDTQFSAFLSPSNASGWIWGVGAIAQLPTHTDTVLGNNNWGLGPTAVALHLQRGSPWVYGALVNNVWSLDTSNAPSYNNGLIQPFLNYNFKGGTYLSSAPIITVNWKADSGDQWTVPLGGAVGHIFHLGRLPVNAQIGGYHNVVKPDEGPNWQLRAQVQLMFPK
jgi:hypothetical protein